MKKGKKLQRKLEARLNGHKDLMHPRAGKTIYPGQYTAPGSRNIHK